MLDSGVRAHEFLALNLDNFEYKTGEIVIREGKGCKFLIVFLGNRCVKLKGYIFGKEVMKVLHFGFPSTENVYLIGVFVKSSGVVHP